MSIRFPRSIGFALASAILSFMILEAGLQVLYRSLNGGWLFSRTALPIFEADSLRGFRVQKHLEYIHRTPEFQVTYRTDANGFRRMPGYDDSLTAGAALFLGPSFTFGWGVDDSLSYPALMAPFLLDRMKLRVVNLGTPAQSLPAQLCGLDGPTSSLPVRLVVFTVYDRLNAPESCSSIQQTSWLQGPYLQFDQVNSVKSRLKKLGIVYYSWVVSRTLLPGRPNGTGTEHLVQTPGSDEELARSLQWYRDEIVRRFGPETRVLFVHIPLAYAVRPSDYPRWKHLTSESFTSVRERALSLADASRSSGIPLVQGLDVLMAADSAARTYFELDLHLTPHGHRSLAAAIRSVLEK